MKTLSFFALLMLTAALPMSVRDAVAPAETFTFQGSISACFEQTSIANEIEITKRAIERSTWMVSGVKLEGVVQEEETPETCGLKLV